MNRRGVINKSHQVHHVSVTTQTPNTSNASVEEDRSTTAAQLSGRKILSPLCARLHTHSHLPALPAAAGLMAYVTRPGG